MTAGRARLRRWVGAVLFSTAPAACSVASVAEGPRVALGAGVANLWDSDRDVTIVSADYRFAPRGSWRVTPSIGLLVGENGSYMVFFDLRRSFALGRGLGLTPYGGLAAHEGGGDLDLDYPLEFRLGLEASRSFGERARLGLGYLHASNGGFGDTNPSTESALVSLSLPVD